MSTEAFADSSPVWLELPPISGAAPRRLIVFLHGAGSRPEAIAPAAVAFMLKFPGATGAIMQGFEPAGSGSGFDWYRAGGDSAEIAPRVRRAGEHLAVRIASLHESTGLTGAQTVVVGFAQGATLALELARRHAHRVSTVVAVSGRMLPPLAPGETITTSIHLIHGLLDTVVPVAHARQAFGRLKGSGARVTLDLIEDLGHSISQDVIILGTTRTMQTIFRGRQRARSSPEASLAAAAPGARLH